MATVTERPTRRRGGERSNGAGPQIKNREQAAEVLRPLLGEEPQTQIALTRAAFNTESPTSGQIDVVRSGLRVLESLHEAKQIGRSGWTAYGSEVEAPIPAPETASWPFTWAIVPFDQMFVDKLYQRPVTSLADEIERAFDVALFQVLCLSLREDGRYAIMDGQTRWTGARRRGIKEGPSIVYTGLTPAQEASLFSRFQTKRRGMVSWHRFRAALAAEGPEGDEARAINRLVRAAGYEIGDRPGQIKAIGALENTFRRDKLELKRILDTFKAAWPGKKPEEVPDADLIKGGHYFLLHHPINLERTRGGKRQAVNDERLVRRLKTVNASDLRKRMISAKDVGTGSGNARFMGYAIQQVYLSGGR